MNSLNLNIPQQHDYTDPTVERNVARLREWLTNLPLMDVAETMRLVLGALDALNEQKLDADLRFECLEAYRTTAQRLFQTVDPLHLRQLNLSKAQRKEAISGVGRVFLSLAGGYKLIVTSLYEAGRAGAADPLFGKALHRALEQLSYALLDGYRFYRETQYALIGESHTLYRLARKQGVPGVSMDVDDVTGEAVTTAMLYHTSMLVSLTDPARLPEGEAGLLFDILMEHAGLCSIIPGNSWEGDGEGLFLVVLKGDKLPISCTQLRSPVQVKETYLLDATRLLREIRARLANTPAKVRMQSPEAMLLRRLLPEKSTISRRREKRHKDGRYVELLVGLDAIHDYIRRFSEVEGETQLLTRDGLSQCRVLDSSKNGMRLHWEEGGAGDARVGDLLGVLEQEHERQVLRLSIMRSIRVYREGGLETGVQLLSGGLGAVTIRVPDGPEQEQLHALFMPADEKGQYAATLIALKGLYERGRNIVIDVGGKEVRVCAGRRVFDSPVFDRFEFTAQ